MLDNLKKYNIVLASCSPRRKQLLAGLGIEFETRVIDNLDESYPAEKLSTQEVALYIATKKAEAYRPTMRPHDLIITADTVVISGNEVLGKPNGEDEARHMLERLSGKTHCVMTGVCLMSKTMQRKFTVATDVSFKPLTDDEIRHYITNYRPFDKAGAYGIQEWIGYIGVTGINGSYFNVMGLPVQRIYQELQFF